MLWYRMEGDPKIEYYKIIKKMGMITAVGASKKIDKNKYN